MLILGLVIFKLIVTETKIHETMPCLLIHNMKMGTINSLLAFTYYRFSIIASHAFQFSGKNRLKQELKLGDELLKQFCVYAIIGWLKISSASFSHFSGYGENPSKVVFDGKTVTHSLPKTLIEQNIFLKSIKSMFPLNLPEKATIKVENGSVILDYKLMQITISIKFNEWLRGLDSRMKYLLNIPKKNVNDYAMLSGIISFETKFKFRSIFSRDGDRYYIYSKKLVDNLRCNFSSSNLLENIKEAAFWKHINKDTDI